MTIKEQKRFIRELIRNVEKDILDKVYDFPSSWDGHELRQYIADQFAACNLGTLTGARKRNYQNTVLVSNL